jgi:hypothetical protein
LAVGNFIPSQEDVKGDKVHDSKDGVDGPCPASNPCSVTVRPTKQDSRLWKKFLALLGTATVVIGGTVVSAGGATFFGVTRFLSTVTVTSRGKIVGVGTVDLEPTIRRIQEGRKLPFKNDGSIFENREGILPDSTPAVYREYVIPTPGVKGPGSQRLVVGFYGEMFYTPDHYKTFIQVRGPTFVGP